jgi:hypothetical protein
VRADRDEFAFLGTIAKVLAVMIVLFLVAVVIASLNPAPPCGPGTDPGFCVPAASLAP